MSPHDTVTLDGKTNGGIKDVRQFIAQLQLSPQFGTCRLGVIAASGNLTLEAQNALLKLLEEPPRLVKILLFADSQADLLPTILSRAQRFEAEGNIASPANVTQLGGDLESFLSVEALAKSDQLDGRLDTWLAACYNRWCQAGRSAESLDSLMVYWDLYRNMKTQINKRLLLEQLIILSQ